MYKRIFKHRMCFQILKVSKDNTNLQKRWLFNKYDDNPRSILPFRKKVLEKSFIIKTAHSLFQMHYFDTAWKVSKYGVISGPYFPVVGLNMEIYFVNLRIQSEYRKIRTRNNSVFEHFSRSVSVPTCLLPLNSLSKLFQAS